MYLLPGWEGSAGDSRVLCDAICRPNGLTVPEGMPHRHRKIYNVQSFIMQHSIYLVADVHVVIIFVITDMPIARASSLLTKVSGIT